MSIPAEPLLNRAVGVCHDLEFRRYMQLVLTEFEASGDGGPRSRCAEAEEVKTTAEIAALGKVIEGIAAAHGGRVFNTAGESALLPRGPSVFSPINPDPKCEGYDFSLLEMPTR